jgi:hypothetical protein
MRRHGVLSVAYETVRVQRSEASIDGLEWSGDMAVCPGCCPGC